MIYFIQENEPDRHRVKIGYTSKDDVGQRLRELQTASPTPLRVLGVMEGERAREAIIHSLFSGLRLVGEWFEPTVLMYDFVREFGEFMIANTDRLTIPTAGPTNHLIIEIKQLLKKGARLEKNSSGYYRLRWQVKDEDGNPALNDSGGYIRKSLYVPHEFVPLVEEIMSGKPEVRAVQQ